MSIDFSKRMSAGLLGRNQGVGHGRSLAGTRVPQNATRAPSIAEGLRSPSVVAADLRHMSAGAVRPRALSRGSALPMAVRASVTTLRERAEGPAPVRESFAGLMRT